jgi:polyadenylation factor subunit 2
VFSGGGEKPPDILDMAGQDDEDDTMVPGFSYGGGSWWGKEEDGFSSAPTSESLHARRPAPQEASGDDFIPGFGISENPPSIAGRQSGPLPSQEELVFGTGGGVGEGADDWGWERGGNGGGGRASRWGPRRGGGRF